MFEIANVIVMRSAGLYEICTQIPSLLFKTDGAKLPAIVPVYCSGYVFKTVIMPDGRVIQISAGNPND